MASTKIDFSGSTNTGVNILADHSVAIAALPQAQMDWLGIQKDLKCLRELLVNAPDYIRDPMKAFSREAEAAAKQSDWERFKAAAKKIGSIGLHYLRDLSVAVLADFVSKALS